MSVEDEPCGWDKVGLKFSTCMMRRVLESRLNNLEQARGSKEAQEVAFLKEAQEVVFF